jgi:hypothetical protein
MSTDGSPLVGGTEAPCGRLSPAHAAIHVPELLDQILVYCTRRDLTSAARVSRLWFEHAMDALWWDIDGLEPFIHLLGTLLEADGLPESEAELVSLDFLFVSVVLRLYLHVQLEEFPTEPVLSRFLQYARRVRSFTLSTALGLEGPTYARNLWRLLINRAGSFNDFPNLRSLEWTPHQEIENKSFRTGADVFHATHFMSPALDELIIYVPYDEGMLTLCGPPDLRSISTNLTKLRTLAYLELRMDISVQTIETELVELLRQLANLRRFFLPGYWHTSSVLEAVSELSHLDAFGSVVDDTSGIGRRADVMTVRPALRQGAFSQLSTLSLCASIDDTLALLSNVCGPRLRELTLQSANFLESPAQVRHFLTELHDLARNIEVLTLELRLSGHDAPVELISDSDAMPLSLPDLLPVGSLPNLADFALYHLRSIDLSDNDLEELLKQLPGLAELRLGHEPFVKPTSVAASLTCAALAVAARCCPRLECLGLFLDTSSPNIPEASPAAPVRFACLADFDIGSSLLATTEIRKMGEYLDHLLPPGCTLSWGFDWHEDYPETLLTEEFDNCDPAWEAVSAFLEVSTPMLALVGLGID